MGAVPTLRNAVLFLALTVPLLAMYRPGLEPSWTEEPPKSPEWSETAKLWIGIVAWWVAIYTSIR
jgi:hypothetical protein